MDDNRRTRVDDCKFPDVLARDWDCAACKTHRHSQSYKHVRKIGVCQWALALPRATYSRKTVAVAPEEAADAHTDVKPPAPIEPGHVWQP